MSDLPDFFETTKELDKELDPRELLLQVAKLEFELGQAKAGEAGYFAQVSRLQEALLPFAKAWKRNHVALNEITPQAVEQAYGALYFDEPDNPQSELHRLRLMEARLLGQLLYEQDVIKEQMILEFLGYDPRDG